MMMRYYPVNLDIRNRKCLIVGGGSVSLRKTERLLKCGAKISVVSPVVTERLAALADNGAIVLHKRPYRSSDINDMFLVIAATDNEKLNRQISGDAKRHNILCNIVDYPEGSDFILPSTVNRGDLQIAVSTSGNSPAFAKKLQKQMENQFGEEYLVFLKLMGAIRKKLLSEEHNPEKHKLIFEQLVESDLAEMIKKKEIEKINSLLFNILGEGYDFNLLSGCDTKK